MYGFGESYERWRAVGTNGGGVRGVIVPRTLSVALRLQTEGRTAQTKLSRGLVIGLDIAYLSYQ
jgi:hypothetical protein